MTKCAEKDCTNETTKAFVSPYCVDHTAKYLLIIACCTEHIELAVEELLSSKGE